MQKVEPIWTYDQMKLLSDSRRMAILRMLMASPSTLTHLARALGQSPAWIRHHIKLLEAANLVEIAEVRTTGTITEKHYWAKAGALLIQKLILPKSKKPAVIFSGSGSLLPLEICKFAQPVAALLVLVTLATFIFLRLSLLKENTS